MQVGRSVAHWTKRALAIGMATVSWRRRSVVGCRRSFHRRVAVAVAALIAMAMARLILYLARASMSLYLPPLNH